MNELADLYLSTARRVLSEGLRKIEHCTSQLTDDQIWWRPREGQPGEMNSIANLLIHLAGNLNQWILTGVGGAPLTRHRQAEFDDRSHRPPAELLQKLKARVAEVDAVIARQGADDLLQPRSIQNHDTTVLGVIFHVVEHFRGHVQEIIHMTRTQLGPAYKFDFVPDPTRKRDRI
jgi:hypothetical protein